MDLLAQKDLDGVQKDSQKVKGPMTKAKTKRLQEIVNELIANLAGSKAENEDGLGSRTPRLVTFLQAHMQAP